MFIIANFLNAVAYVLDFALTIYMYIMIARAIISWVNPDPYNPIVSFLYRVTEPVLQRVRRVIPTMGMMDFSPIVVFLAILFLQKFVINSLFELVSRLKYGFGG